MLDANIEKIAEDETTVTYRLSWYVNGELKEKWIVKNKDELEDEEFP